MTAGNQVRIVVGKSSITMNESGTIIIDGVDVYVNGVLLGRHRGGFTPFNTEVTDVLVEGQNAVVVKVDSQSTPTDVPTEYNDWLNYGGLTREVLLVEVPAPRSSSTVAAS